MSERQRDQKIRNRSRKRASIKGGGTNCRKQAGIKGGGTTRRKQIGIKGGRTDPREKEVG